MTHCPRCHQPLDRSTSLIPGVTVVACRKACRRFAALVPGVEPVWREGGTVLVDQLREDAFRGEIERAIVGSDGDDPRWERLT